MAERTHQRSLIRQAVVDRLILVVADVAGRVYPNRRTPIDESNLPGILVYTESETVQQLDNIHYKRTVKLSVEAQASGVDEPAVAAQLDALATKIEEVFFDDEQFVNLVEYSIYTGSSEAYADEGRSIIGAVKLDFDLIYYTENVQLDPTDGFATLSGSISGLESETAVPQ